MTQQGETDGYSASDHLQAIIDHSHKNVIDACLVNNADVPVDAQGRYETEASFPVAPDVDKIKSMGYMCIGMDLLSVNDYVRHDSTKLTKALIRLIEKHRIIKR